MLLFYLTTWTKVVAAFKAMIEIDRGPKRDRCPECGGTDYFNGYGLCLPCEPM